jgi:CRP-like cAMP-binding protein
MSHFVACMFYFTARLDNFGPNTWVTRYDLEDESNETKYLKALYFTITILTTVGFGDITPFTYSEMILSISWMVLGIAFYSTIVSSISSLFSSIDSRRLLISEQINDIDRLGKFYDINSKCLKVVKQRISDHISFEKRINEYEKSKIIRELPRKIQNTIIKSIYKECVTKIKFFVNKDFNFLIDFLPRLRYQQLAPRVVIYDKHDSSQFVFFLMSGRVSFVLGNQNLQFKSIVSGTYFGEIEVLNCSNRKYKVISEEKCEILVIPSSSFEEILMKYPLVRDEVCMLAHKRNKTNEKCYKQVVEVLETVEIKQEAKLEDLAGSLSRKKGRKSYMNFLRPWNNMKTEDFILEETNKISASLNSLIKKVPVKL